LHILNSRKVLPGTILSNRIPTFSFGERRKKRPLLWSICFIILLTSCVTNKQVFYLQKGDVNAQNLPKDTLMRTYDIQDIQYRVQPEDIISIRIESLTPEEFDIYARPGSSGNSTGGGGSGGAQGGNSLLLGELVDHHGEIPFILSGKVKVQGMTVYQIQDTLQRIANQYLKSPIVRARLLNYRFTVLGLVNKEGLVTVNNNRVSILEAIALAGGLDDLADRANVKLIRQHDGKAQVYYVNLLEEKLFTSPLYYTQQNDIIIVPPLRQRTFRKYTVQNLTLALSTISLILVLIVYSKYY